MQWFLIFKKGIYMNELIVKNVDFNGAVIQAAQDKDKIIWVGVRWVCEGLGLKDDRMKYERKKIQKDMVLSKGVKFYPLGNDVAQSDVLCLKLDFLPLWLAKISITPTMRRENPQLVENLMEYQLRAKDVLAAAFLNDKNDSAMPIEYSKQIADLQHTIEEMRQEQQKLYRDMSRLANIILDWKERQEAVKLVAVETAPTSTREWKSDMYDLMDAVCAADNEFILRSDVMKWIYRYMNKNYGIVWEQETREYKYRTGVQGNVSTIDVVENKPILRSIFEAVLKDLVFDKVGHVTESSEMHTKLHSDTGWVDEVIRPLIEKYNDKSNAGMVTYRRVYRHMENYKISWSNLTTRYIRQYGKTPSKKDLIETRPSLRKKFQKAVEELLAE